MTKKDLPEYVLNALKALSGKATIPQICKHIWDNEVSRIPEGKREDLFYTWGYDVRWAGQHLRDNNLTHIPKRGVWAIGPNPNPKSKS